MSAIQAFRDRLGAAQSRFVELELESLRGLTDADGNTGEQWEAGDVLAHLAEAMNRWPGLLSRLAQGEDFVLGRPLDDPSRVDPIKAMRGLPLPELRAKILDGCVGAIDLLSGLDDATLEKTIRVFPSGTETIGLRIDRSVVGHLEAHTAQLESLRP